ncbi:hypothetical protein AB0L59_31235 [Streptomyces sp. NPDC052109]|uniref:hypothetical protein n=1 Tax=Streptomyces sp. NPDC052109 TaxID=3155527 RepID=UPI003419E080
MANERLRAAISAKGETIQSVVEHGGVDPKSVERWITTSRTPHRGHPWKAASFLGADEVCLWPSAEEQAEKASASGSYSGALHLDVLNHAGSTTVCGSKADGMGAGEGDGLRRCGRCGRGKRGSAIA